MSKSGGKKIAILGFAREGAAVLKFLQNRGFMRMRTQKNADKRGYDIRANLRNNRRKSVSEEIWILDKNPKIKIPAGLKKQASENYLKNLSRFDLVFRSPGIPYGLPELVAARKKSVRFGSGTKIFFEEARKIGATIIGITGTKGKGTTCTLLYRILQAARKKVFFGGNVGKPMLDLLPKLHRNDLVILELSSFQLQDLTVSPQMAVVLDIFPDHQDSHINLSEYYGAKANIAIHQKTNDKIFYFPDNKKSAEIAAKSHGKKIPVGNHVSNSPRKAAQRGRRELENEIKAIIKIPGSHNLKNAVMAATVALSLGVSRKIILDAVKKFRGTEHRLEFVRKIKIANQSRIAFANIREFNSRKIREIRFYDDSASTNPNTAAAAVRAFSSSPYTLQPTTYNLILIAGGKDKNLDYSPLAKALKEARRQVALVVLMGENRKKIQRQIANSKASVVLTKNLNSAVKIAYLRANTPMANGYSLITVLFSPGAASFDMFKNYADRGEQFKKLVRGLK